MSGLDQQFQEFLDEGRFMIQRNPVSGNHLFYPRIAEPRTGQELEWVEASGDGTVYAVTITRKRDPNDNYNVVLVDLTEGPRMMSRVDGIANEDIRIGMKVKARVIRENEKSMVVFEPAADAQEDAA